MVAFDKVLYWKNKLIDKLQSIERGMKYDFEEIAQIADHIKLDHTEIQKNMAVVILAIQELRRSILKAKQKKS